MIPSTLLDRLLGRDPAAGLAADYEATLNQRTAVAGRPALPDLADLDPDDPDDRRRLAAAVERVLRAFDPRIDRVRVRVGSADPGGAVRLAIDVTLAAPPAAGRAALEAVRAGDQWTCRPTPRTDR